MKKIIVSIVMAAALIAVAGCAKRDTIGPNDANKRYLEAWMSLNYPGLEPTGLGIYVIEQVDGTGVEVKEDGYVLLDYVTTDIHGNITAYTGEETAKQVGEYSVTNYYGPKFSSTFEGGLPAGLIDALKGMKVGGHKKVIIPTWLMTYSEYKTEEEYLNVSTDVETKIYDFTIEAFTEDINEWQVSEIGKYFDEHRDVFGTMTVKDSIPGHEGFYYKSIVPAIDTTSFKSDTTVYINYTGRLLNGKVFDTTDERLAKDSGIWSSSKTYAPTQINWGEAYTDITMGSGASSVISGFALTLWQMRAMEKGVGVFIADYGYSYSGSGDNIPAFTPLVFEIELVPKPE